MCVRGVWRSHLQVLVYPVNHQALDVRHHLGDQARLSVLAVLPHLQIHTNTPVSLLTNYTLTACGPITQSADQSHTFSLMPTIHSQPALTNHTLSACYPITCSQPAVQSHALSLLPNHTPSSCCPIIHSQPANQSYFQPVDQSHALSLRTNHTLSALHGHCTLPASSMSFTCIANLFQLYSQLYSLYLHDKALLPVWSLSSPCTVKVFYMYSQCSLPVYTLCLHTSTYLEDLDLPLVPSPPKGV